MIFSSSLLENAVNEFAKLPGIGKKTALRLVLHLIKQDVHDVNNFSSAVATLRSEIKFCSRCHNISDKSLCNICSNNLRRQEMICVVENIRDVIAIESTQQFNGVYHVLGGIISPLDGMGPEQLQIESLINRIAEGEITEIIFALKPQYTRRYYYLLYWQKVKKLSCKNYYHCPWHCIWRRAGVCR